MKMIQIFGKWTFYTWRVAYSLTSISDSISEWGSQLNSVKFTEIQCDWMVVWNSIQAESNKASIQ